MGEMLLSFCLWPAAGWETELCGREGRKGEMASCLYIGHLYWVQATLVKFQELEALRCSPPAGWPRLPWPTWSSWTSSSGSGRTDNSAYSRTSGKLQTAPVPTYTPSQVTKVVTTFLTPFVYFLPKGERGFQGDKGDKVRVLGWNPACR